MKAKTYYCSKCRIELGIGPQFRRRKYCESCNPNIQDWSNITLEETREKRNYQVNSRIRELARSVFNRSGVEKKCVNCGYDKHIEVCHIKGISEFDGNTPINEINDINNIIPLCPNCHWEFDHNLLNFDFKWLPKEYNEEKVKSYNQQHTKSLNEVKQFQLKNKIEKEKKKNYCVDCGIEIGMSAHRCIACLGLSHRKTERPSRDELKNLIRNQSFLSLGKQFGVSDNAIRKWCVDYHLPNKKSEIKQYTNEEWQLL